MDFFLFVLVNATLFLRPAELLPSLAAYPIYEVLILSCLVFAIPRILKQLSFVELERTPILLFAFGILIACGVSHIAQMQFDKAVASFVTYAKVMVYFVLLLSIVRTPRRLRWFMFALGTFICGLTALSVLRYYEVVTLDPPPIVQVDPLDPNAKKDDGTAAAVKETYFDPARGETVTLRRMRGTGIFNDPNDLGLALTLGLWLALYGLCEPRMGAARILCLGAMALMLTGIGLTFSRGSLLALMVGAGGFLAFRHGFLRACLGGLALMPLMLVFFAGRMTEVSADKADTAMERVFLWRDGIVALRYNPIFGTGMGTYPDYAGLVAHNSYLHAYAELGIPAGTLFLGMFYITFLSLWQLRGTRILDKGLDRMAPFMVAIVASFCMGIFALSRCYDVSTYCVLGLATVYPRIVPTYPPIKPFQLDTKVLMRLAGLSVAFLVFMYVFIKVMT